MAPDRELKTIGQHDSLILTENPTRCKAYKSFFIPYLNDAQHVSGDTQPIIRSLQLHKQPLVLHNVVGCCWKCSCWTFSACSAPSHTLPDNVQQLHVRQPSVVLCKTRGYLCSFRLL